MPLIGLVLLLALAACEGAYCVDETGPGVSGTVSYTTGDGAMVGEPVEWSRVDITRTDPGGGRGYAFEVGDQFLDASGRPRSFRVEIHDVTAGAGPIDLANHGVVCIQRQALGELVCSELTGTVDVRTLYADCYNHGSGIRACAESWDFTLEAASDWMDTRFVIEAEGLQVGEWTQEACGE